MIRYYDGKGLEVDSMVKEMKRDFKDNEKFYIINSLTNTESSTGMNENYNESEQLEIEKNLLRGERNQKLVDCDWTQLQDSPLTSQQITDYQTYRQSLRDIPNNISSFDDLVNLSWPTEPSI